MEKELREYFDKLYKDIEEVIERVNVLEEEKDMKFLRRKRT